MAILDADPKYEYCNRLSVWSDLDSLLHMLEPFRPYPARAVRGTQNCVVRMNKHGMFAVFVQGKADERLRYKLEVSMRCRIVVPVRRTSEPRRIVTES